MENRAQAVCNAGGLGVVGGAFVTPDTLRTYLRELKEALVDKSTPFGVDLLLPQVGGGARATNKDYTRGTIHELVDIMIEEGCTLFVCAVGVRHTLRTGVGVLAAYGRALAGFASMRNCVSKWRRTTVRFRRCRWSRGCTRLVLW